MGWGGGVGGPPDADLEAARSRFPGRDFSVIVHFELGHHGDEGFDDEGDDVGPDLLNVHALGRQPVQHAGQRALAARALAF